MSQSPPSQLPPAFIPQASLISDNRDVSTPATTRMFSSHRLHSRPVRLCATESLSKSQGRPSRTARCSRMRQRSTPPSRTRCRSATLRLRRSCLDSMAIIGLPLDQHTVTMSAKTRKKCRETLKNSFRTSAQSCWWNSVAGQSSPKTYLLVTGAKTFHPRGGADVSKRCCDQGHDHWHV